MLSLSLSHTHTHTHILTTLMTLRDYEKKKRHLKILHEKVTKLVFLLFYFLMFILRRRETRILMNSTIG